MKLGTVWAKASVDSGSNADFISENLVQRPVRGWRLSVP